MASRFWWPLLGLLFLLSVALRIYLLAGFVLVLAIVGGLAILWRDRALESVRYSRRPFYRRGFPGETFPVQIEVENHKILPLSWLRVEDRWSGAVGPEDESLMTLPVRQDQGTLINLFSLRWFEKARRTYSILLRKRGVHPLGPVRLESGDLFGLFTRDRTLDAVEYLTVFPQPLEMGELGLPTEDPFGDRRSRQRLFEDPTLPMGIRDYHPEDDFRHVHWPATARTGSLQVKVYQPTSAQVVVFGLNVTTTRRTWEGTYSELLEHLVSLTTTLVQHGLEDGYRVGLISNGSLAHADQPFRVPPGRSPRHRAHLLTTLASVTPFTTSPFDRFLLSEASRLPFGATLVIVTAFVEPELVETLLRLKSHSHHITLISVAGEPPPPAPGINFYHLPFRGEHDGMDGR